MKLIRQIIATWFFTGYLPKAPGSWAAMATFPALALFLWLWGAFGLLAGAALIAIGGGWALAGMGIAKNADPAFIVIDEVLGQWIAATITILMLEPPLYSALFLSFCFFRLLDIFKPWPVHLAERLPGAWGIMGDDILAGAGAGMGAVFVGLAFA